MVVWRALVTDPQILVLDEATANSDDELMAAGGLYRHLYTSAHASFDDQVVAATGDAEFASRS